MTAMVRFWLCAAALVLAVGGPAPAAENLLHNGGFDAALEPHWQKRTPEDETRKLYRLPKAGRAGSAAAVLENVQPAYTRLRQGHERTIVIQPGSLVQLSAWIRSELSDAGDVTLQLYCMDRQDRILAQPCSAPLSGAFDWTPRSAWVFVPEGTAYVMAYLQVKEGVGKVYFDDVELVVAQGPVARPPAPKVVLFGDLPEDSPCLESLKTLFEDGLVQPAPGETAVPADAAGMLVLYTAGEVPEPVGQTVRRYAGSGGHVFMDMRSFARWQGTRAVSVGVGQLEGRPAREQMKAGLRVVVASQVTAGLEVGHVMPRAGFPDGHLMVLPESFQSDGLEVLAVEPEGHAGLVRTKVGRGWVVGADVLSLREPDCRHVDAYYKYTLITNALTNPVRFGHYYPRKLSYAELVEQMKAAAEAFPEIRFAREGAASDGQPIGSLNLGSPGKPLYFLYAAAHGSEWEPGYGLFSFAKQLAEGRFADVVDLKQVEVKIVPILNPSGYDHMRRQNANGVDLNRQGDYRWEEFSGSDSNKDGTWGPMDYDWKGKAPLTEAEARVYQSVARREELFCILDFHGNSCATANKVAILPATARADNAVRAIRLQQIANARLRGRHLLRQTPEKACSQYLLERVQPGGAVPYLMNTSARERYGVLIELTAGYPSTYGTVLQTDVTCELCRALFAAYPPPRASPGPAGKSPASAVPRVRAR